jgi:cell division protein FtsL
MRERFIVLWTIAAFATAAAFIVHLTLRFEILRLGYTIAHEHSTEAQLAETRRVLSLESATLRQVDRVEAIGRGAFGMEVVPASRVIQVHGASSRVSGRAE